MSQLHNIQEKSPARTGLAPSLPAFLALGFRPLYLAGAVWALVSIGIWIFAPQLIGAPLSLVAWHAHEMLWGFIITIAVGFLLTASATWTGHNPLHGWPLGVLALLWLVARIGFLVGGHPGFWVATVAELVFFLAAAASIARVVLKGNSRRNYGLPLLLVVLAIADLLYLQAALRGDYLLLMQRFNLGLVGMAVVALLIARRVIPFFSMRMVKGLDIPRVTRSGHYQMGLGTLALLAGILGQPVAMAVCLALTGLIGLVQLVRWQPLRVLHKPMLWILYLGYAFLCIGLLAAAWQISGLFDPALLRGVLARSATYVHLIGMAGFCILIIGMLTRTALGHLGRPLALDRNMLASHWLMILAVVFRLAALWPSAASPHLLHLAALAWILCMGLYVWRFFPLLIRPRPDRPQPAAATRPPASEPVRAN